MIRFDVAITGGRIATVESGIPGDAAYPDARRDRPARATGLIDFHTTEPRVLQRGRVRAHVRVNSDFIIGVKVRMGTPTVGDNGLEPPRRSRDAAELASFRSWPTSPMHPGSDDVLKLMRPGDIIPHCFSGATKGEPDAPRSDAGSAFAGDGIRRIEREVTSKSVKTTTSRRLGIKSPRRGKHVQMYGTFRSSVMAGRSSPCRPRSTSRPRWTLRAGRESTSTPAPTDATRHLDQGGDRARRSALSRAVGQEPSREHG
jgi:hypothetical protein